MYFVPNRFCRFDPALKRIDILPSAHASKSVLQKFVRLAGYIMNLAAADNEPVALYGRHEVTNWTELPFAN